VRLLIVLLPDFRCGVCLLSGRRQPVLPGVPGCAPAPTAPGWFSFRSVRYVAAGQVGAGKAQSRCQQVRNASFHGQSGEDPAAVDLPGFRWQVPQAHRLCRPRRCRASTRPPGDQPREAGRGVFYQLPHVYADSRPGLRDPRQRPGVGQAEGAPDGGAAGRGAQRSSPLNRLSRPRRSRTRQVHHRFNRHQERIRETPAHRHAEFSSGLIQG
jgi:hypothetical protein